MSRILTEPTETAQWYALLKEAQTFYGMPIPVELESYLVFLLQRFTCSPQLASSVLALEYLESQRVQGRLRDQKLREVGDKCLLFSGIFPERAINCHVSVSYFVDLGRKAYQYLAELPNSTPSQQQLFLNLYLQFVHLMDILQCIRELGNEQDTLPLPLAEDLWRKVGSRHALKVLQHYSRDSPNLIDPRKKFLLN